MVIAHGSLHGTLHEQDLVAVARQVMGQQAVALCKPTVPTRQAAAMAPRPLVLVLVCVEEIGSKRCFPPSAAGSVVFQLQQAVIALLVDDSSQQWMQPLWYQHLAALLVPELQPLTALLASRSSRRVWRHSRSPIDSSTSTGTTWL